MQPNEMDPTRQMGTTMAELADFELGSFRHNGVSRPVYRRGSGPGVIVMHEVPGITPEVAGFARRVADRGFTVFMPAMFGVPGAPFTLVGSVEQILRACISREFHVLAQRGSSPITVWLRALCRRVFDELGGRGVGAIGMCLTGNFALSLMVDPWVMAPVLSQPSLPFTISPSHKAALHVSDADLAIIKRRVANEEVAVLGLRFTHDWMCPPEKFDSLRRELGSGFEGIEIDSGPGNAHGITRMAHSVVTNDLVDDVGHPTREALERVMAFFENQLTQED